VFYRGVSAETSRHIAVFRKFLKPESNFWDKEISSNQLLFFQYYLFIGDFILLA